VRDLKEIEVRSPSNPSPKANSTARGLVVPVRKLESDFARGRWFDFEQ
jgi:hypothetical protein